MIIHFFLLSVATFFSEFLFREVEPLFFNTVYYLLLPFLYLELVLLVVVL